MKKTFLIRSANYLHFLDNLKKSKKDFKVIHTGNSTRIDLGTYENIYSSYKVPLKYLHLFSEVKKEVLKNVENKDLFINNDIDNKKILFNYFKKHKKQVEIGEYLEFENVIELDIVKAYYNAAFLLGFIGEDFYKKCLELPKTIRLMLLGSIASVIVTEHYVKGELVSREKKENSLLRKIWFNICEYVDNCLFEFSELVHENFLFYYVDGIFLKYDKESEDLIKTSQFFCELKYKLKFKIEHLEKIKIYNYSEKCTKIEVFRKKDKGKPTVFLTNNIFV